MLKTRLWPQLPLEKQDYLGEIIIELGTIACAKVAAFFGGVLPHARVAACGGQITRSLVNTRTSRKPGTITINMVEIRDSSTNAVLQFAARHLDQKDLFGKSDGFVRIRLMVVGLGARGLVLIACTANLSMRSACNGPPCIKPR